MGHVPRNAALPVRGVSPAALRAVERPREPAAIREVQQSLWARPQLRSGSERAGTAGRIRPGGRRGAVGRVGEAAGAGAIRASQPERGCRLFRARGAHVGEPGGGDLPQIERELERRVSGRVAEAGPGSHRGDGAGMGPSARPAAPVLAGKRLKELYRAVVRRLHPDSQQEMTAQKTEWGHHAQAAYEAISRLFGL